MLKPLLITCLLLATSHPALADKNKPAPTKAIGAVGAVTTTITGNDCPLTGSWRSNREKTLSALNANINIPLEQKARLSELFGKVTLTFDAGCTRAEADVNGTRREMEFALISYQDAIVTIKDRQSGRTLQMKMQDDCYLMEVQGAGIDEYYCRVK